MSITSFTALWQITRLNPESGTFGQHWKTAGNLKENVTQITENCNVFIN
jgi:hypothetical protein